jgi:integrase
MATNNSVGVYQKDNGYWEYRFVVVVNGKKIARKKCTDELGNKLKTKREAIAAREAALVATRTERIQKDTIIRCTVKEVYDEYCTSGRKGKAYQTIRKQDSLWKNHLSAKFGNRYVDDFTPSDVMDYLSSLYYVEGYSYQYTESFLKMFYLIFGQAYARNHLEVNTYNRLCLNKNTKIKMPKMKVEDDTAIISFSRDELALLDEYFKGTNVETAYLLGRYCGLRINETFGLKWANVDLEKGTITIDRQMQYQNGLIKLISPKTRNSKRVIYMAPILKAHLAAKYQQMKQDEIIYADLRKQNQRTIEDLDGSEIFSTELVNSLPNGTIQTVNSMKYPAREIKKKLHINFKYHHLRHTFGTMMADLNTPVHLLCDQMGHGNIHVTQRYYLAISKTGIDALQNNLNKL